MEISQISFKEGSTRSLAMTLISIVGQEKAWGIARKVESDFGKNFTRENAMSVILSDDLFTKKETEEVKFSAAATHDTKNAIIRKKLLAGETVVGIKDELGLKYQRVNNVRKDMIKKKLLSI